MLFNSYTFLFLFLPLCLLGYWVATRERVRRPRGWLILMSLTFYAWWEPAYLLLLAASITLNYGAAHALMRARIAGSERALRWILGAAVSANIALLAWFKYLDFLLGIVNDATGAALPLAHLVLPLAISFYTLVQIAFLCDLRAGKVVDLDLRNYLLFVCFFPHMIAGPIIHHSEMMPQFEALSGRRPDPDLVARGSFLFTLGLFKKVCLADTLARASDTGFAGAAALDFAGGWITALSYSLQLYFDFSGYSDMAIGLALLFGIQFPLNFESPYKAPSIREFWHRWHMTLSRFLRDYVYVPLGGNRAGALATQRNLFLTFLVGGLWHGAGWPFVIWGALHGGAMVVQRAWSRRGLRLPPLIGWMLTFLFVVAAFVMFRAPSVDVAVAVYRAMLDAGSLDLPALAAWRIDATGSAVLAWIDALDVWKLGLGGWGFIAACLLIALLAPNSNRLAREFRPTALRALFVGVLFIASVLAIEHESPFIYFQF
jgi:alginate O-acetyltransferase complex protein AlgI